MQAHAIRLDDAWVTPTWIGLSFCLLFKLNQETGSWKGDCTHYRCIFECSLAKQEKNGNKILYLSGFLHLNCPPYNVVKIYTIWPNLMF